MSNWVQNYIQLEGPREEILRFRELADGYTCCGFSLCMHALNRIAFTEEVPDWAADLEIVDDDKFDKVNCAYSVYSAWYSILPLILKVSPSFPAIKFSTWSNDLCAGCGYEYHLLGSMIQDGRASEMYHTYWTEYQEDNIDKTVPIATEDEFVIALSDPLVHWQTHSANVPVND